MKNKLYITIILLITYTLFINVNIIDEKSLEMQTITICIENICDEYETSGEYLYLFLEKGFTTRIRGGILYTLGDIDTNFVDSYIAIYVNDEYSTLGIMSILICDGCEYKFIEVKL